MWINPSPNVTFDAQTISVTTEKTFDSFMYECSDGTSSRVSIVGESGATAVPIYVTISTDGSIQTYQRNISAKKTSTGYNFVCTDCTRRRRTTDGTITDSTQNGTVIPLRIFGITHND